MIVLNHIRRVLREALPPFVFRRAQLVAFLATVRFDRATLPLPKKSRLLQGCFTHNSMDLPRGNARSTGFVYCSNFSNASRDRRCYTVHNVHVTGMIHIPRIARTVLHTPSPSLGLPPVKANGLETFTTGPAPLPKPNMIKPPRATSAVSCAGVRGHVVEPIRSPPIPVKPESRKA